MDRAMSGGGYGRTAIWTGPCLMVVMDGLPYGPGHV